jgi:hypothetical protein
MSDSLRRRTGPPRSPAEEQLYEPYFTILRKRLDEGSGRELRDMALSMSLDEVVAKALNQQGHRSR